MRKQHESAEDIFTGVSAFWTGGAYSGSPGSAKLLTNCAIPTWKKKSYSYFRKSDLEVELLMVFNGPVYGRHFLFSGGGLNSNGGRGSNSFKRLAVKPVGWLCPICIRII